MTTPITPGYTVTHKMYVPRTQSRYMSDLMPGAYVMGLFGDVVDELGSRLDGVETMIACYSDVQFKAPILVGDILEVTCELLRIGQRSRDFSCTATVLIRRVSTHYPSRGQAGVLTEPLLAASCRGVAVIGADY